MNREAKWVLGISIVIILIIITAILAFRYANTTSVQALLRHSGSRDERPAASVILRNGFGNQLFEVAALLGYAERYHYQPILDLQRISVNAYAHSNTLTTDWYHGMVITDLPQDFEVVREQGHATEYSELVNPARSAVLLDGWFQSPRYFPSPEYLRKHIYPPPELVQEVTSRWSSITSDPRVVCIHIRRGDYNLISKKMLMDTKETYYLKALELMATKIDATSEHPAPLAVFSDDQAWCQGFFARAALTNYTPIYVREKRDISELALMTTFKRHIISNSTFGWWGAVLADSPEVIAPYPWDALSDGKDIYMKHWTLL
jgi:hypothetical protein